MKIKLSLLVILCASVLQVGAQQNTLTVGFVDTDPAKTIKKATVFVDYMSKNLGSVGINSVTIVVAKDLNEMVSMLETKKVDLYIDSIFPVLQVAKKVPLEIGLRRWKKGVSEYNTVFLAKKTSAIKDLVSLAGLTIGFEDAGSSTARYLPQLTLMEKGYSFVDASKGSVLGKTDIGFLFTGSSANTPVWLMQGKIDIGVVSSDDYEEMPDGLKNNMKIIGETAAIPRQLIAFRGNLPTATRTAVTSALLKMDSSEEGKTVLKSWEKTTKIDVFPADVKLFVDKLKKDLERTVF